MTDAITEFVKANGGERPRSVLVYREGIAESAEQELLTSEVQPIATAINHGEPGGIEQFSYVMVNKRVNAKFFRQQGNTYDNPPMGTVVDSGVVRANGYDFFLIPVTGRSDQGAVCPVHYTVIYSNPLLPRAELSSLTYNLCFLYYNWSGPVKVPAPIQNAHKLAYLYGEHGGS